MLIKILLISFLLVYKVKCHRNFKSNNLFDLDLYESVLDEKLCEEQLIHVKNDTLLYLRFLDAGLGIPKGILKGNSIDMGNYLQCLEINDISHDIQGKYCMIKANFDLNLELANLRKYSDENFGTQDLLRYNLVTEEKTLVRKTHQYKYSKLPTINSSQLELTLATCIPKSCTTRQALSAFYPLGLFEIEYQDYFCRLPNDKQWVVGDYVAIVIFSLIGFLTILSTGYDVHHTIIRGRDPKTANSIFKSCSLYNNTIRLLSFNSGAETIECLDGIRALAILSIFYGHSFATTSMTRLMSNRPDLLRHLITVWGLLITAPPLFVDTFFFLSGFLLVYTTTGKFSSKKLIKSIPVLYLQRLLRMFPILAAAILLEVSFIARVIDGPHFEMVAERVVNCRNHWWKALLYIQNFTNYKEACLGHSWYLDVDVQLYILSPLLLFWVFRGRRSAWICLVTVLLLITVGATVYNFHMNFQGNIFVPTRDADFHYYMEYYYINTFIRAAPFIIGMIFGYTLFSYRDKTVYLQKMYVAIIWFCITFPTLLTMWYLHKISQFDWDNQLVDNVMNSFMRTTWAISVGLLVFVCSKGYGGPINWFLSLKIWKFVARISYAIYMFHYPIMLVIRSSIHRPYYFTFQYAIYCLCADLIIAITIAILATLLIDAPFSILVKKIFQKGLQRQPKNNQLQENKNDSTNLD